jgi:hypothetical protein
MEQRYTSLEWAAMQGGHEVLAVTKAPIKLPFLQELTEARMYRGRDTLQGKTAEELARVAYLMLMMLEILRTEDNSFAKNYSLNTLGSANFVGLRTGSSDLHNILAVLNNQNDYADRIIVNAAISVPTLQIRRYLRDIENDRKQIGIDRAFLKKLDDFFKISDSSLKEIRRVAADWNYASPTEKGTIRRQIKNALQSTNHQNDLLIHFRTKL